MSKIKIAIAGVGNCASALIQGLEYYLESEEEKIPGIMFADIGGYRPSDIKVVAAFEVDNRKIGKPIKEAIFAKPNCCRIFSPIISDDVGGNVIVNRGPVLDGVSEFMENSPPECGFQIDRSIEPDDVVQILKDSGADILLNYCPVGSQEATEFYAQAAIGANIAFLNCIPVFIASNPEWEQKFIDAKLPIIGDDMRSAVGASVISQVLQELLFDRGAVVDLHTQINQGFNTDFRNMEVKERLASKKISKENVIKSQNVLRNVPVKEGTIYAGPAVYVQRNSDEKVAFFDIRARAFGDAPIKIDVRLSCCDSENSAGIVIDAIRYLKVARELGIVGSLRGPSAWTQKTPPEQMFYADAKNECQALADRQLTDTTRKQVR